jgi:hypothetical protein
VDGDSEFLLNKCTGDLNVSSYDFLFQETTLDHGNVYGGFTNDNFTLMINDPLSGVNGMNVDEFFLQDNEFSTSSDSDSLKSSIEFENLSELKIRPENDTKNAEANYSVAANLLAEAAKKSSPSIIDPVLKVTPLKASTGRRRGAPRKNFESLRALESKKKSQN